MTTFIEASNIIKNFKYSENSFLPHTVTIPLSQELHVTCNSLVQPGDIVREGDIIASNQETSSFIHSSVPGKVLETISCEQPNGKKEFAIKILAGGKFTYLGKNLEDKDLSLFSSSEIIKKMQNKGIVDTFDVSKPINIGTQIAKKVKAKYLIVRLFDEDNYRYTDSLITKFYLDDVIKGAKALAKAFNAQGILLAVNAKSDELETIYKLQDDFIKIVEMNIKRYPSGTRREIISAYNRNVKKTHNFEITKYDYFTDAATAYEVYKSVYKDIPAVSKPIFFNGNCLHASGLINVRIGTTVGDVVKQIGGFIRTPGLVLVNGMIVGTSVSTLDIPITKYIKSITINSRNKHTDKHIYSCINCGSCRLICTAKISPDLIYNNSSNFKPLPETIKNTAIACTNCGLCNIVCPSRLPLCQTINVLRDNVLKEKSLQQDF